MTTPTDKITEANGNAAVFLLPPYDCPELRQDAQNEAADLCRQAIRKLIRAGHDDLAFRAQALALMIESAHYA